MSIRLNPTQPGGQYLDPILELDLPTCINANVLQGLPGEIVVCPAGLERSEDLGLIDAAGLIRVYRAGEGISVETRYRRSSATPRLT